jgi:dihydroorotase
MLTRRARSLNLAKVYPVGALTAKLEGERLTEMAELADHGCVAFSQANAPITDTQVLWRALQYAATFGFAVWLRPQDSYLAKNGVAHDGEFATRLGLPGIPALAETVAVGTILQLVRATGTRVHLCRLSTAEGVAMVRAAKRDGLPVTCDVAVHHLHLSDMDIGYFDSHAHVVPPFRSGRDRDALRAGVADGTIDAVCSDHTPVDEDANRRFGEPGRNRPGPLLPLAHGGEEVSAVRPDARPPDLRAGAGARSTLAPGVGAPGDVRFDPSAYFKVTASALRSQGKNTPYLGYELPGVVRCTLVRGDVRYEALA